MTRYLLIFAFALVLGSCGSSSDSSDEEAATEAPATESTEGREVIEDTFGVGGNLYKPRSDVISSGAGNVVVLFDRSYSEQMEGCSIPLKDGTSGALFCINNEAFTQVPFSCFSNGGRQTWRGNFKCEDVGEVVVMCRRGDKRFRFSAPGGQTGNVCTRFG